MVIAAHNEARNPPGKIASLARLDYPADRIQWIIVSVGTTDDTVTVVEELFAGQPSRTLLHHEQSLGKCGALNKGVAAATGDNIPCMDARQPVSSNAIKALVPDIADPAIGAVSGELVLSEDGTVNAAQFGHYWRYEKWIRDNAPPEWALARSAHAFQ